MWVIFDGTSNTPMGKQLFIPEEVRIVAQDRHAPPARLPAEPSASDLVARREARILALLRKSPMSAPELAPHFNATTREARAWLSRLQQQDRLVVIGMRRNTEATGRQPIDERVYDAKDRVGQ